MKTVVPNYYSSFKCIADKCRHSCCIGWEIDIDDQTFDRYQLTPGVIGEKLRSSIKSENGTHSFILEKNERCPFLNEHNLCDIYSSLGEESLCQICTDHPRFRNYLADRVEMGIGMCCEEAARIILSWDKKFCLETLSINNEKDKTNETDKTLSEDEEYILSLREHLIKTIAKNENDADASAKAVIELSGTTVFENSLFGWCSFLESLEMLDPLWGSVVSKLKANSAAIEKTSIKVFDRELNNLMIYILYRHMINCSDIDDLYSRIGFSAFAFRIVKSVCTNTILEKGDCSFEELVNICRMFSSEIEYSEDNISKILFVL